ncbi:MAG: outer membrane beta-barrel protein [Pseudomonadota bacterium]
MKTLMVAAATAALALAAPALAQAQSVYGNLGYASVDVDPVSLGAVQGRLGVRVNDNFAVEGEAAFGVAGDDIAGVDVDLDNEFGAFLVVLAPVGENTDIFARAGFASAEVDAGPLGSTSDDGGAYGVGIQHFFGENDGFRFDYTHYEFGGDADSWAIAWVHRFN